ncbi:hypothetical protein MCUN1_001978 [Malassezia cuniculi]|uniref:AMP-activated protein kinase glycogen-binding domain-containing protein n=1 Tax=Malassezia cuniculi TaxID=948313 RepID=A0AAF0J6Z8_9BASI|nr:hypothetical protein MCUN1_001978 [Malassezia cuniculi]
MTTVPVIFVWPTSGPKTVAVRGTWEGAQDITLEKQESGAFVAETQLTPGHAYFFSYIVDGEKTYREDLPWSTSGAEKLNILSSIVDPGVTYGTTDGGYEPKSKATAPVSKSVPSAVATENTAVSTEADKTQDSGIVASIAGAAAAGASYVGATVASVTGYGESNEKTTAESNIPTTSTGATSIPQTDAPRSAVNSTIYTTGTPSVLESRNGQVITESIPIGHSRIDDIDAPLRPAPAISTDYTALLRQSGSVETTSTYLQPITATKETAPSVSLPAAGAAAGGAAGVAAGSYAGYATQSTSGGYPTSQAAETVDEETHEPWSVEWPESASKSQAQLKAPEALSKREESSFGNAPWSVKDGKAAPVAGAAAPAAKTEAATTGAAAGTAASTTATTGTATGATTGATTGTTTGATTGSGTGAAAAGAAGAGAAGAAAGAGAGAAASGTGNAKDAVDGGKTAATGVTDDAKKTATGAVGDSKNAGTTAVTGAKDTATGGADKATTTATGAATNAKSTATGAATNAKNTATGTASNAKNTATGAASNAKGKAEGAPKKLGFFGKIKKAFKK